MVAARGRTAGPCAYRSSGPPPSTALEEHRARARGGRAGGRRGGVAPAGARAAAGAVRDAAPFAGGAAGGGARPGGSKPGRERPRPGRDVSEAVGPGHGQPGRAISEGIGAGGWQPREEGSPEGGRLGRVAGPASEEGAGAPGRRAAARRARAERSGSAAIGHRPPGPAGGDAPAEREWGTDSEPGAAAAHPVARRRAANGPGHRSSHARVLVRDRLTAGRRVTTGQLRH
jgi:hypothetical protein